MDKIFVFEIILPFLVLCSAVVFDLLYKKFPNYLAVSFFALGLFLKLYLFGFEGLTLLFVPLVAIGAIGFLLYYLKILGAGDVKLLFVLSVFLNFEVLKVFAFSILWGGILGAFVVLLKGQTKQLILNLKHMVLFRSKLKTKDLNFIPYTVCLLLGFLTHLILAKRGFSW